MPGGSAGGSEHLATKVRVWAPEIQAQPEVIRTFDGHRVTLCAAAVAPAIFHPVVTEHGAQPRLVLQVRHLCFLISAGHCNERQAGHLRHTQQNGHPPGPSEEVPPSFKYSPSFLLFLLPAGRQQMPNSLSPKTPFIIFPPMGPPFERIYLSKYTFTE